MAIARPAAPNLEGGVPSTIFVDGDGALAGLRAALPSDKPAAEAVLAIDQMRLVIEDGVLMVLGPEGDPVPPQTFGTTAAAYPGTLLGLPDGTKAPASRVAEVLRAQILGRLAKPGWGDEWILAMLRQGGGPEPASEAQLRAEHGVSWVAGAPKSGLPAAAEARGAGVRPGSRMIALGLNAQSLADEGFHALVVRDVPPGTCLSAGAYNQAIDGWMVELRDLATLTILPSPELRTDCTVTLMGIALRPGNRNAVRTLARLPVRLGSRAVTLGLNPNAIADEGFQALVVRDVPAGASLSAGAYNTAIGGWLIQPQDLPALAILPPPELRTDFTVTLMGLALRPGDTDAVRVLAWLTVRIG